MNRIILTGRLTKAPEINNGTAKYSIAVDRQYKDKEGNKLTDFFNIVSFGNTAAFIEKYVEKGTKILVDGELRNNNYTNKDNKKVYQDQIIGNSVEVLEWNKDKQEEQTDDGFNQVDESIDEDSLPFV